MQIVYIDGFDHYTDVVGGGSGNRIYEIDPNWSGPRNTQNTHGALRDMPVLGGQGLFSYWDTGTSTTARLDFFRDLGLGVGSGDIIGAGFHFYPTVIPGTDTRGVIAAFASGVSAEDFISLKITTGGNLQIRTAITGTIHGTSTEVLSDDVLYHIEFQVYLHASAGEVHVRVNGEPFLDVTGIDTLSITPVGFGIMAENSGGSSTSNGFYIDNLFVWKDEGPYSNTWVGEKFVDTLFPNEDLSPQDWSLSAGSDAYDLINNVPASDSSYVESDTVGDISAFGLEPYEYADVIAVQTIVRAAKTGTEDTEIGVRLSGEPSAPHVLTQDQQLMYPDVWETNPATSLPWDPSDINNLQIEIERVT